MMLMMQMILITNMGCYSGHQLSWDFSDSSHGNGLMEGLDGVRQWVRLEIVQL
jgi:hypothetical protein